MVTLAQLWLPVVLSAVVVFVGSSILHMVLKYHRSDYRSMPGEDEVAAALRKQQLGPGTYFLPHCVDPKDLSKPEVKEKFERGPVGMVTIMPSGPPSMAKPMASWVLYCLVMSLLVAYLTGRTVGPGAEYLTVFRVAGTAAFLGYAGAVGAESI